MTNPDTPGSGEPEPLLRQLTVWGIALLVVNGTIGAGIFGLPGRAAALTGPWSPAVILVCGLLLVPIVLAFAEASSYFRGTGGPILYARTAFGPFVGFETGWAFYVTRLSASAANLSLLVASLGAFDEDLARGPWRVAILFALSAGLVWVNLVGAKQAMASVGVLTVLKFVPLLLLVVVGFGRIEPGALLGAELPPAGEAREPARDMPRALLGGLTAIVGLYVLIVWVAVAALPGLGSSERPLVDVGAELLGPFGAVLMTVGVAVSVGGNVASATFSTPRITYAMARERLLPAWFGRVHPVHRTPGPSIVLYGVLMFALAAAGSFAWLAEISVLTRILIYVVGALALPRLRRRHGAVRGPLLPLAAALVCAALLTQVGVPAILATAAFLAVGTLLYLLPR